VGSTRLLTWRTSSAEPTRSIPIDFARGVQLDGSASRAYVTNVLERTVETWDLTGHASYLSLASAQPRLDSQVGFVGFLRPAADGVHVAAYAFDGGALDLVNQRTGQVSLAHAVRVGNGFAGGAWRPDGRRFAYPTADGHVQVFDVSGRLRSEARVAQADRITDVDFTPDGHDLAVADLSGRVQLVDVSTWSPAGKPIRLPGPAALLTLSPDGRTAFGVTRDHPMTPGTLPLFDGWALLDLETGAVIRTGTLSEIPLFADFSPDGVHVAVSFFSGRVWILDTRTGQAKDIPTPLGQSEIYWLSWSRDGSLLLGADSQGTVSLWETATGTVQSAVTVPGDSPAAGQFRPGTSDVTLVDNSGHVLTWDTRPEHAIEFACRIAGRDLTADEWRTYVGTGPQFRVCPS
jgi:WD40 repeat protein